MIIKNDASIMVNNAYYIGRVMFRKGDSIIITVPRDANKHEIGLVLEHYYNVYEQENGPVERIFKTSGSMCFIDPKNIYSLLGSKACIHTLDNHARP